MDEALHKQPWRGAVSLHPSHAPSGLEVGLSVSHSKPCNEDLLSRRAFGWAWGCAQGEASSPWQLDSLSLFPLPEAQEPVASAWQEHDLSHVLAAKAGDKHDASATMRGEEPAEHLQPLFASPAFQDVHTWHDLGKEKPGEHPLQKWLGRNVSVPG